MKRTQAITQDSKKKGSNHRVFDLQPCSSIEAFGLNRVKIFRTGKIKHYQVYMGVIP